MAISESNMDSAKAATDLEGDTLGPSNGSFAVDAGAPMVYMSEARRAVHD